MPFLTAYLEQPRLEHLVKVGFFSLASDMAYNRYDRKAVRAQHAARRRRYGRSGPTAIEIAVGRFFSQLSKPSDFFLSFL